MVGRASGAGGAIPCKFGGKRGRGSVFSPKAELQRCRKRAGDGCQMADIRQERRRGWQAGRGKWAAGSVNYDSDGWRRRCGGLLLSPLPLPSLLSPDRWPFWMTGRDRSGSLVLVGWRAGFALVPVPMTGRRAGAGGPSLLLCWPSPLLSPPLCSLPLAVVLC